MVSQVQSRSGTKSTKTATTSATTKPALTLAALLEAELAQISDGTRKTIKLLPDLIEVASRQLVRAALRRQLFAAIELSDEIDELLARAAHETGGGQNSGHKSIKSADAAKKESKAFTGLVEEAREHIGKIDNPEINDHKLVSSAQKILHVEIAALGTAAAHAEVLGHRRAASVLHRAVQRSEEYDQQLTDLVHRAHDERRGAGFSMAAAQQPGQFSRRNSMPSYRDDDDRRGYGGRSTQERDEYGQFSGGRSSGRYQDDDERGSSRRSRYDDDDRGSSSSRSRSDDDERFGGYEGRSRGGSHSAEMQERDEYGRFSGSSGNGGRYSRDDDDDRGRMSSYGSHSRSGNRSSRDDDDDRGRSSSSNWGGGSSRSSRDDDDDRYSSRSSGGSQGNRGRSDDYTDSAGRHYTRESWERAQEGRAMGGQHSHGGRGRDDDDDDRGSSRSSGSRGGRSHSSRG